MIYIIKHREYDNPIPKDYVELGVGNLFINDDKDNINELNLYINELTGLYHIWKNIDDDIVGLCHYRRFFWYNDDYLTIKDSKKILKDYDIIVTNEVKFENWTLYWQLRFEVENSDTLDKYIAKFEEKIPGFEKYLKENNKFSNREMFVCKKEVIEKYCEWLFPIIIPITEQFIKEDSKNQRVNIRLVSHIVERLFDYWIKSNNLKVYNMDYKDI